MLILSGIKIVKLPDADPIIAGGVVLGVIVFLVWSGRRLQTRRLRARRIPAHDPA